MIIEERIDTIEDLKRIMFSLEYNESIDRHRSLMIFRGLPRVEYKLKTSLDRNCGLNPTTEQKQKLEKSLLDNFSKYACIDDPSIYKSVWRQLILGQHHGLPTRLLDWTHSFLVALHFAVTESNYDEMDKHDCAVWQLDMIALKEHLPELYKDEKYVSKGSYVYSIGSLNKYIKKLEDYDKTMNGISSMIVMEPPSIDQRIVNQYSFFTVVPSHISDIEETISNLGNTKKYIISKDLRWYIRDMLDQFNISERIIYPGLDGTAKWLGRHYYVKKK